MIDEQQQSAVETSHQLREYLAVVRLRKWTILLVTTIVIVGAMFLSFSQTPIYEAESRVLVEPIRVSAAVAAPAPNLVTEEQVVTSTPVATLAAERLNEEAGSGEESIEPEDLITDLSVEVATNSEILIIRYRHEDPVEAQRRTRAISRSYIKYRRQKALDDIQASARAIQERIDALNARLQEVNQELAVSSESDPGRPVLQAEASAIINQIPVLRQRLFDQASRTTLRVGQIIEPAEVPTSPVSPDHTVNGILGLLGGLALGVGVAFLRERLDDRFRGRADFESRIGAPVFAVVPRDPAWRKRGETPLQTLGDSKSRMSEAYRALRTGLLFAANQQGVKTILITSAHAGEGKTSTTANLGVVLAQAGKRVILISADLRKPRLHRFFGLENEEPGLSGVLMGNSPWWSALERPTHKALSERLRVLPSGQVPDNPSELLGSEAMRRCIEDIKEVADFVLIDAPPILVVADASAIGAAADGVLFVADAERTTREAVAHAKDQLQQVNAPVVGAVLNNFDPFRSRVSPYSYQYYYTYRYGYDGAGSDGRKDRGKRRARSR